MDWLRLHEYLSMPADISTHGGEIDVMMGLVHWLMIVLFVIWAPYFLYTLYRFRASTNPNASYEGSTSEWSRWVEVGVVLVEAVLLVGFAIPIWSELRADFPPEDEAVEVRIIAQQFSWNIHYPGPDGIFGSRDTTYVDPQTNPIGLDRSEPAARDDIVTIDELHLVADQPAILRISSLDVIHSFFLPNLRVKQDAIPGMSIPVWVEPTETGDFEIACAQLCGLGHYRMNGYLTVHDRQGFEAWRSEAVPDTASTDA